jgi:hypothetical protein
LNTGSSNSLLLPTIMLLASVFLAMVAVPSADIILQFMTTDGCGQVLHPTAKFQLWLIYLMLNCVLFVALILEFARPKAYWSAWVIATLPLSAYFVTAMTVGYLHHDFLTECDLLFPGEVTLRQLIFLGFIMTVVISIFRVVGRRKATL